ncbi:RNA polymerase sigma-70 factor, ECF subfamily [Tindallia magadiensis]|uniref:RNA polymerase sigma-70 factor, ECF subfamily n=1 Tax=Tindallia magadiensis TaxID=69895 RepID=A0A1I3FK95_9FIRM|nr:RNA polymerase sigma factor [Tindallia magadiensis]SFI11341.1 RNA polymerase sigma-70 factor, ECF subfamily [Tindallia magadiensis]
MISVSSQHKLFQETYERLWPQVYQYAYYRLQSKEEAEEISQEVFRKVFQQVKKGNIEEEKIRAYIFAALRNTIYDTWRQKGRSPKIVELDQVSEKNTFTSENQKIEENMMVREALKKLPEVYQQVVVWRIVEGYPLQEVAERLGKPVGTVKSLQFRGVKKLKEILEEGGYFNG